MPRKTNPRVPYIPAEIDLIRLSHVDVIQTSEPPGGDENPDRPDVDPNKPIELPPDNF